MTEQRVCRRALRMSATIFRTMFTESSIMLEPKADFSAWVQPEDLARVMLFLASDGAREVTGALIPVMGRV